MAKFRPLVKLSSQHYKAIKLDCEGRTIDQLAKAVGRSRDAVAHWRCDPLYKAELEKRLQERAKEHRKEVGALVRKATDVLTRVMNGDTGVTTAQRQTAMKVLGISHLSSHAFANAAAGTTVTREDGNAAPQVKIELVPTDGDRGG